MVLLYKSHVLSYAEYRTPAIANASCFALHVLDAVQDRFLRAIGLVAEATCVQFKLAPLFYRRDIVILGVLHRFAIERGPSMFHSLFRVDISLPSLRAPRSLCRHLIDPCTLRAQQFVTQSALGAVRLYNILPDFVVAARSAKKFQIRLSALLRCRVAAGHANWPSTFSWRCPLRNHSLRSMRDWCGQPA